MPSCTWKLRTATPCRCFFPMLPSLNKLANFRLLTRQKYSTLKSVSYVCIQTGTLPKWTHPKLLSVGCTRTCLPNRQSPNQHRVSAQFMAGWCPWQEAFGRFWAFAYPFRFRCTGLGSEWTWRAWWMRRKGEDSWKKWYKDCRRQQWQFHWGHWVWIWSISWVVWGVWYKMVRGFVFFEAFDYYFNSILIKFLCHQGDCALFLLRINQLIRIMKNIEIKIFCLIKPDEKNKEEWNSHKLSLSSLLPIQ